MGKQESHVAEAKLRLGLGDDFFRGISDATLKL